MEMLILKAALWGPKAIFRCVI